MAWKNVTIKASDVCGDKVFSVVTLVGGYTCRSDIHGYEAACKIASAIDDKMTYEATNGAGSLDTY